MMQARLITGVPERLRSALLAVVLGGCTAMHTPAAAPRGGEPLTLEAERVRPDSVPFALASVYGRGRTLVAAGHYGNILRSEDGGATWRRISIDVPPASTSFATDHFTGIHQTGSTWYAAGGTSTSGFLYRSDDEGRSWSRIGGEYRLATFTDVWAHDDLVLGLHTAGVRRSADGGSSWNYVEIDTGYALWDLWGAGSTIVAVGHRASSHPPGAVIYRSADAGVTWVAAAVPELRARLSGVWGEGGVWVAAGDGHVLRSVDDGLSWEVVVELPGSWAPIQAVHGAGAHVFAVGLNGRLLRSPDGADSWACVDGPEEHLSAVWSADSLVVAVGGEGRRGFVSRSLDYGQTWDWDRSGGSGQRSLPLDPDSLPPRGGRCP